MPGGNPLETARVVFDEVPDLQFLAELPGRGPGADMIGRAAALLVDIPVEVTPGGWRIADHPGRDMRRARTMLSSDLDAMEEVLDGYQGLLKLQLAGPWTLAATIEQSHWPTPAWSMTSRRRLRKAPRRTWRRLPSECRARPCWCSSTSRRCPLSPTAAFPRQAA